MNKPQDATLGNQLSLHYQPQNKETFLGELATFVLNKYKGNFENLHVIFPNRRAGLYFLKELANQSDKVKWAPRVHSLEDFYEDLSPTVKCDRYSLIFRLYRVYRKIYNSEESLDNFFFWGEMLLKDFDEIDKSLIDSEQLFSTLSDYKSIDQIEYLDEEQKKIISRFWLSVDKSRDQKNWVDFWSKLSLVYKQFREELKAEGLGYTGMILREWLDKPNDTIYKGKDILFAGFNALTRSEESFIRYFVDKHNADILWDFDEHYMHNQQEAGKYLRAYKQDAVLGESFDKISSIHLSEQKNVKVIGTGTWMGQLKVVGQLLEELSTSPGWEEESTVVVLPDEKLLLPLLNAIPATITDVNVTMGITLRYTSSYSFLENVILLFKNSKTIDGSRKFYYKNILTLLRHPLYQAIHPTNAEKLDKLVQKTRKIHYSSKEIEGLEIGPAILFEESESGLFTQLSEIAYFFFNTAPNKLEKIFLNALYHHLDRLSSSVNEYGVELGFEAMIRLFKQIGSSGRIPFSGEPVKGLQIMGVFESRNIDFDNVFILSLNEGFFPRGLTSQSFIPFTLRQAFKMPTFEDNQSIQSYLFYRLLQRSKKVHLLYNSIGEVIGGEVSRYIQQIKYGNTIDAEFLHLKESYQPDEEKLITVKEMPHITDSLSRYFEEPYYLSPTAINSFISCKLKFYFRYILRLKEENEVEEEIDAKVYGLLLHESAEYLYGKFKGKELHSKQDLEDGIEEAINWAFSNTVFDEKEGHPRIRKEILIRTLKKLIDKDSQNFPIQIVDVEPKLKYGIEIKTRQGAKKVIIGGKLDRVDKLDGSLRVIDYKTGKDEPRFDNFDKLFAGQNSAAFQLFCYSLLLKNSEYYSGEPIRPELYSMRQIFSHNFAPNLVSGSGYSKQFIYDIRDLLPEFEERLQDLLAKIFYEQDFTQTEDIKNCKYCEFTSICRRERAKTQRK